MPAHDAVPALLRAVWDRNLPLLRERLDHLDRTASDCLAGTLSPDDHALALTNAHKLSGSLGTFGYPTASDLARSIETLLESPTPLDCTQLQQHITNLRSELGHL